MITCCKYNFIFLSRSPPPPPPRAVAKIKDSVQVCQSSSGIIIHYSHFSQKEHEVKFCLIMERVSSSTEIQLICIIRQPCFYFMLRHDQVHIRTPTLPMLQFKNRPLLNNVRVLLKLNSKFLRKMLLLSTWLVLPTSPSLLQQAWVQLYFSFH